MHVNSYVLTALVAGLCVLSPLGLAQAQSIEVGELGAAQDFDAGVQIDGALDPALWQNTSAEMAAYLLARSPVKSKDPMLRGLVRSVVLTGGVPPQTTNEAAVETYNKTRLRTVMALNEPEALQALIRRSPDLMARTDMRAEAALAAGDTASACNLADNITQGRSEPFWAKLRAFCHVTRGEIAAAELTANLLQKSGYKDPDYFALLSVLTGASTESDVFDLSTDPLYAAMATFGPEISVQRARTPMAAKAIALNPEAEPQDRLEALFIAARILDDASIRQVLSGLLYDKMSGEDLQNLRAFTYDGAIKAKPAQGFAQLFMLTQQNRKAAPASEFLKRAEAAGQFKRFADLLKTDAALIPASERAEVNLPDFARMATLQGDVGAMQAYFRALPEGPQKPRIALASDAIGNGFYAGSIGFDIESRLTGSAPQKARARRDAYLALALGASMSDAAAFALEGAGDGEGRAITAGDITGLRAAAKAGSRAETALRAAALLEGSTLNDRSFADVIAALMEAGLTEPAGKLAARDFLSSL